MKKKVVVLGGGFTGSIVAKQLEKHFDTTLIDKKNYFEFSPGILRIVQNPEYRDKITSKHSNYLKKTKIISCDIKNLEKDHIMCDSKKVPFDYLVIATGSKYGFNIKIKNVINATNTKAIIENIKKVERAKSIAVIGGGLVGVELAAEIIEKWPNKKVTIIHSRETLIERNHPKSISYVEAHLTRKGVEIIKNERALEGKNNKITTDKGTKIKYDLCFLCTGVSPNTVILEKNFNSALNERKQINVNEFLQLENHKNMFAGGDLTNSNEEKTAQAAEKQGKIIAGNIIALESNKPLKKYEAKKRPMIISLGKWSGVIEHKNIVISGLIPAFIKKSVEIKSMLKRR